ncbi:hypothetical protein GCM10010121_038450 [Streptomyces brasiliensis]|uniref:Uncharacterized protein n=1 Tax=Streptomyces brasiliensis TaxID=1954 RepID=A0A917KS30_9ACTN|nr:hypothetical protein GCM10010121_038450 [Streptomyces brasiliensis]
MDAHGDAWTEGPPAPLTFMPPEATRLFDVALPLLMRSAPDRRNLWLVGHSRVMSGTRTAPPLSRDGAAGPGRVPGQPLVPNAIARYCLAYEDTDFWAKTADMYRWPRA